MKRVSYVGGHDEVEIAATGQTCKRGESIEVDDDLAGRPPKGDPLDADGNPNPDYDYGEGLLAQPDNWQPAKKSTGSKSEENVK
jgi:hypothetical protein